MQQIRIKLKQLADRIKYGKFHLAFMLVVLVFNVDAQSYPSISPNTITFAGTPLTGSKFYYTASGGGSFRYAFSGVDYMRFAADGSISISDNNSFDQQLILNLSHNGASQDGGVNSTTYSNAYGNTFTGRLAGGTAASPLATPINGKLAEFTGKGHTGSAFSSSNRGLIGFYAARTFNGSAEPTRAIIKTVPLGSTTLTNVMVFEENGSAGITPNDTLNEIYPAAFDATNARFLEITATGTGSDVGLFMQNRSMVEGLHLWHDNSANISYLDDMLDNSGSAFKIRVRTLGTPVDALTISGTGAVDYTNRQGYVIQYSAANFNPADATTYYIGGNYSDAGSTADVVRIYILQAGTITAANIFIHINSVLGTTETATAAIRLNNTTDYTISSEVTMSAAAQNFSNTALSIPVVVGDYVEIKLTCPTYATNPTAARISGGISIK